MAAPAIESIAAVGVPAGKTLFVPVRGSDADGDAISYTASSSNPDIQVSVRSGHPWLKLTVAGYGEMVFQLFDDLAPNTVEKITELVNQNFYDNLTFHRVVGGFVNQGGDPQGTGAGGPGFTFDDEFNPAAIFSGTGQLAMANSGKDTNGSQFFITLNSPRFLDFNHTIYGQLVRGFDVAQAINSAPVDSNDKPTTPIVITDAAIVANTTDTVLQIKGGAAASTSTITLTATDAANESSSTTFAATSASDATNDPPILGSLPAVVAAPGSPVTFDLNSTDLEGDAVEYQATILTSGTGAMASVSGNKVTLTPAAGFTGTIAVRVGVKQQGATSRGSSSDPFDTQVINVSVVAPTFTGTGSAVAGGAGAPLTSVSLATFVGTPSVALTTLSAIINWGDSTTSAGVVSARSDGSFEVRGTHTYANAGNYAPVVTLTGPAGSSATATASAVVSPTATSPLTVSLVDSADPVTLGGTITYVLRVTNPGSSAVAAATARLTLPSGSTFVSATTSVGDSGSDFVSFNLGTLAAGETRSINVTIRPGLAGSAVAQASVSATGLTPVTTSETTTVTTTNGPVTVVDMERYGVLLDPTVLVVAFSGPVDAASAEDTSNYLLRAPGRDGLLNTRDDVIVPIDTADYDSETWTVTLSPRYRLHWSTMSQLRIRSGVIEPSGNALDGDGDGAAGGDFLARFGRGTYRDLNEASSTGSVGGVVRSEGIPYEGAEIAQIHRPTATIDRYRQAAEAEDLDEVRDRLISAGLAAIVQEIWGSLPTSASGSASALKRKL